MQTVPVHIANKKKLEWKSLFFPMHHHPWKLLGYNNNDLYTRLNGAAYTIHTRKTQRGQLLSDAQATESDYIFIYFFFSTNIQ